MGCEFETLTQFLALNGIRHFKTPPCTPQHNDIVERMHRIIVETGLALLHIISMPLKYWTYA